MCKGNYIVYRHVSPDNKMYVGITCQKINRRWENGNGYRSNPYFTRAIKKYGWDNFKHEILLKNLTKEQAECAERLFIGYWNLTDNIHGYNLDNGGNSVGKHSDKTKAKMSESQRGRIFTDEHRKKLSLSHIGKPNKRKGIPLSDEAKRKLSDAHKGKKLSEEHKRKISLSLKATLSKNPRQPISEEHRKKLSEAHKGHRHSDETKMKMSKAHKGRQVKPESVIKMLQHRNLRPVLQIDINTNKIINTFPYIADAERTLRICHISECCNGKRKTAGGYKWRYAE